MRPFSWDLKSSSSMQTQIFPLSPSLKKERGGTSMRNPLFCQISPWLCQLLDETSLLPSSTAHSGAV